VRGIKLCKKRMNGGRNNILIISHTFPPKAGIGGRRWAKFSKYLQRFGRNVYVLTCFNKYPEVSEWKTDVEGIRTEYLPALFPTVVDRPKGSIVKKIQYKLWLAILKFCVSGNYFDRTIFWKYLIQSKISEYIRTKDVDCVIVTAGPFKISYYVTQLKKSFPEVKFIVDFRDFWTEDSEITSFTALSKRRIETEKKWEKATAINADVIISVADKMTRYFASLTTKNNCVTIPNGYDPEDFVGITNVSTGKTDNKIRLVFTGTLYIKLEYILEPFFKALAQVKASNTDLYNRVEINFVGNFPSEYKKLLLKYDVNDSVKIESKLSLREVYQRITAADYCLLFLNNVYNFALSTKFCEYISQRKKIIVVANDGYTADFVIKNDIGYWIDPRDPYHKLVQILENSDSNETRAWQSDFNVDQFSLPNLTEKLIKVIDSPFRAIDYSKVKRLLLTFDYELFLGVKSGKIDDCLIRPTSELLKIMRSAKINGALFFVDTTYLLRLTNEGSKATKQDYETVFQQLIEILQSGHVILPHIHPHWLDATYNDVENIWHLRHLDKYRFHHLTVSERETLFEHSISLIQDVQKAANVFYEIDGFRAGGWCIQPFVDYRPLFDKFNIKYDYSVLRNKRDLSTNLYFDFTNVPKENIYRFSNDVLIEEYRGTYIEVSISTIGIPWLAKEANRILEKVLWLLKKRALYNGISVKREFQDESSTNSAYNTVLEEQAAIELLTLIKRKYYIKHLKQNDFLHMISHPKMIDTHHLKVFEKFLRKLKLDYEIITNHKEIVKNYEDL
jgi:glycosyltransferase involved in cell wall biosynthesis